MTLKLLADNRLLLVREIGHANAIHKLGYNIVCAIVEKVAEHSWDRNISMLTDKL